MSFLSIHVSDLHLSDRPPTFRSAEPDWFAAMRRPLDEIRELQLTQQWSVVVYAGDIFDEPEPSPELINFACEYLPFGFAVPGNHDLLHHRYDDIKKTAYWTLVEAGIIKTIPPGTPVAAGQMLMHGFPYGFEPQPLGMRTHSLGPEIAIVHKYIWTASTGYVNAPEESRLKNLWSNLADYDAVHFGDNHQGFINGRVLNAGTMMRRTISEVKYQPFVGLLLEDRTWAKHYLDTTQDQFLLSETSVRDDNKDIDASELMAGLDRLTGCKIDFKTEIDHELDRLGAPDEVREIIYKAMKK